MKALVHLKKKKCPVKYLACAAKHLVCAVKHLICAMSCFVVPILHPVHPNLTCHVYDRKIVLKNGSANLLYRIYIY